MKLSDLIQRLQDLQKTLPADTVVTVFDPDVYDHMPVSGTLYIPKGDGTLDADVDVVELHSDDTQ